MRGDGRCRYGIRRCGDFENEEGGRVGSYAEATEGVGYLWTREVNEVSWIWQEGNMVRNLSFEEDEKGG